MKEITEEYKDMLNSIEDDIESLSNAFDTAAWDVVIAAAKAIIDGASILNQWDSEDESI